MTSNMNGTVLPNCADVPLLNYSVTKLSKCSNFYTLSVFKPSVRCDPARIL